MYDDIVLVGMAELKIGREKELLKTIGLGSCVGLTLYDKRTKIGGLAHIMLPSSSLSKANDLNHAKYADTAIKLLIAKLNHKGVPTSHLEAKLAGGAQMFAKTASDSFKIGPRNVEACREILTALKIPVVAEDVGKDYGRTIHLNCNTGTLTISSIQHGVKDV